MRLSIAAKLFLGFIIIIAANALFLLVVSSLSSLTSVATMLKSQSEVKNLILEIGTINASQERSRVIFENLGKTESVENFNHASDKMIRLIDSAQRLLTNLQLLDSASGMASPGTSELNTIAAILTNDIARAAKSYRQTFAQLLSAKNSRNTELQFIADTSMASDLVTLRTGLAKTDSLFELQTAHSIHAIGNRIERVTRLTVATVFGITLFSLVFGFIFSRMMSGSLRRLRESTVAIGQGDFSFDPAGYPKDEIGDLATAFHTMATDLHHTQAELIHKRRLAAIGEIVASVNHEINNPLMIISGNAQFLELTIDKGNIDDAKQRIKTIIDETDRISQVTRKLRDLRNPVVEEYTSSGESMINLDKSTGAS